MAKDKINISISGERITEINLRGDERSTIIDRDLERYYSMLEDGRGLLRKKLTEQEISLLADCWNGTMFDPAFSIKHLAHEVEDGISLDALDKKWKVSGADLMEKLHALTLHEKFALVDAVERFWRRTKNNHQEPLTEILNK